MQRAELAAWLRLALTPGVGDALARRLLAAFGLPGAIFEQSDEALGRLANAAQLSALRSVPDDLDRRLAATLAWLDEPGEAIRRVLTLADDDYPRALLDTEDPPLMLYVMGARVEWPRAIAMVGSRNATAQGVQNARQFAAAFARSGFAVVSGLALGIDAAAHEGALEGASPGAIATVAVVGTGLDRVYPAQHRALAHRIAAAGLIVSEYPIGTPPLAPNFPKRNRIIAGLSLGTVVVEAALQSGSLITARQAAEQGKDVFAIPGSIHSAQSRGCHALIKQGAKLVETAQDVLEELPGAARETSAGAAASPLPADSEDDVLRAIGFDPATLDALVARTGIPASLLQARLLELELAGEVARLPGGLFQRVGAA